MYYSKELLNEVNLIVNPSFVKHIDFQKLNEAIENRWEVELSSLILEDAESSIKDRLSRILKKTSAAAIGLLMLSAGVASACGSNESPKENPRDGYQTRCFTPKAMEEIKSEQEKQENAALKEQRRLKITKITMGPPDSKTRSYPRNGEFKGKQWNSSADKMSLVTVYTENEEPYVGVLDTYNASQKMLIVPSSNNPNRFYILINKPHVNSQGVKLAWSLYQSPSMEQAGPLAKLYLQIANELNSKMGSEEKNPKATR